MLYMKDLQGRTFYNKILVCLFSSICQKCQYNKQATTNKFKLYFLLSAASLILFSYHCTIGLRLNTMNTNMYTMKYNTHIHIHTYRQPFWCRYRFSFHTYTRSHLCGRCDRTSPIWAGQGCFLSS